MRTRPFFPADRTRWCKSRHLRGHAAPQYGHAIKSAAQFRAYRAEYATGEPPTVPIRPGSRTNGPPKDGFKAIVAASTRREQKTAAPKRQQSESSRSWPHHGACERSASRQSDGSAASRRPPLAASMSRWQPEILRWDGVIRSHGQ